jgi:DNA-binding transcriptional MerR regulator
MERRREGASMTPVRTESADETKLYRSISEVSELVGVKPHVLRYWETQFSMLRPRKNRAGNRMYRPEEIQLLMQIRELLYQRRFTIAGARRRLLDQRKEATPQVELGFDDAGRKLVLHEVKTELRRLLERLRDRERAARA